MKPLSKSGRSKRAAILVNLAVAVGVTGLLLITTELGLRRFHLFGAALSYSCADTLIGWSMVPGSEFWNRGENDHAISGHINSHGWRDIERTMAKPAGHYRVAVIGDSYVEGLQVELDSTATRIAERNLSGPDGKIEVLNFGRSGMTQTEELCVLRRDVLRFAPDVVVVVFVSLNDIGDIRRETALDDLRPFCTVNDSNQLVLDLSFNRSRLFRRRQKMNSLKQKSALLALIATRYNMFRQSRRMRRLGDQYRAGFPESLRLCTDNYDAEFKKNYELNKRLMAEMARECGNHGVAFVVIGNFVEYIPDRIEAVRRIDPSFDPDFYDNDLAALAAREGFEYVGLQREFQTSFEGNGVRLHWAHWNYRGHELVAGVLEKVITSRFSAEAGQ